jgi:hypothetical protein
MAAVLVCASASCETNSVQAVLPRGPAGPSINGLRHTNPPAAGITCVLLVAVISVGAALLVAAAMHAQDCVAGAAILTDSMAADTTHGA